MALTHKNYKLLEKSQPMWNTLLLKWIFLITTEYSLHQKKCLTLLINLVQHDKNYACIHICNFLCSFISCHTTSAWQHYLISQKVTWRNVNIFSLHEKMGKSSLLASTFSQNWSKSLMRTIVHICVLLYFRRLVHFIESYHKSWKMLK